MKHNFFIIFIFIAAVLTTRAQIASNPPYALDQAVIASGGGQNASGGNFSLDGTIGQAIAGTISSNSSFAIQGGFFTAAPAAPTAATVTISGKVLTDDGSGLRNAIVRLTDGSGASRTAMTGTFGYYRFADVGVGETYIVSVESRRYQFAPQVIFVVEELNGLNFTAATHSSLLTKKQ